MLISDQVVFYVTVIENAQVVDCVECRRVLGPELLLSPG
jgi:hypothetical protein